MKIEKDAADDYNCLPAIYAVLHAHYIIKKRNSKDFFLLMTINCNLLQNSHVLEQILFGIG